jgi:hypothetical protein
MSESEFFDWQLYAQKRMLPQRRLELYLAQIAMMVAVHAGRMANAKLADFMFDPQPATDQDDGEASVEEAAAFFGFKPINGD